MATRESNERSAELIKRTINMASPMVAEIGVYRGKMARRLLYHPNLMLTMVDPWGEHISESYKATNDPYAFHTKEEWEDVKNEAIESVKWAQDRVRLYQGTSEGAAEYFADDVFDIVFIDGDHSEEQTRKDIIAWWPLVVPGGYLGGHDYRSDKDFGVIQAVDEFSKEMGLEVVLGDNYTWWIQKVEE